MQGTTAFQVRPLRLIRNARGLSQKELARQAGVDPSTISRLENGHQEAYGVTRIRLARVLGLPEAEIFPGADDVEQ